jgi:hypothetical protein
MSGTAYDVVELINSILIVVDIALLAAVLFFGTWIVLMFKNVDMEILKARLFLKVDLIKGIWIYSICAGGYFIAYEILEILKTLVGFDVKEIHMVINTFFIAAFFLLTHSWYKVLKQSIRKR